MSDSKSPAAPQTRSFTTGGQGEVDGAGGTDIMERYRPEFESALRATLEGPNLPLYDMVRYHMGWQDAEGNPTDAPGKTLRPMLCLLAAEVVGGDFRIALPAAVSVELMHNFSLIHDDIQDEDWQRRGRDTVWKVWGKPQAINAGDLLWAIANRNLARAGSAGWPAETVATALDSLNYAAVRMIEGQYLDIRYEGVFKIDLDAYQEMTMRKTGALFGCAMELGALAAGASLEHSLRFRKCGEKLGVGFQVHDDVLGIWGDSAQTGKSHDNDIIRRKKTLPFIHGYANVDAEGAQVLGHYIMYPENDPPVKKIRAAFERAGSREYAAELAGRLVREAFTELDGLPLAADGLAELRLLAARLVSRQS
ncbi:MAG: polyprenyl synthetase family protein [Dehalococcoidia bacterium]